MVKGRRKKKSGVLGRPRKNVRPAATSYSVCCFCNEGHDPELGTFFQDKDANLAAHQFCLLFSCGLPQAGKDQDGFEGFLFEDIIKEIRRVRRFICKFCLKYGASSGCFIKSCHFTYHYKCGLLNNAQFDFHGTFNTFCYAHRSFQDMSYILNGSNLPACPICLDTINETAISVLKMPCCRNVFAHKECVQNQAMASGYFFRCPTCKNENDFKREMARYGIYIPQRDASWEENDAYSELLQQYQSCDIPSCKCPMGKNYEEVSGKWELIRCYHCGQGAVHGHCLGKRSIPVYGYICRDCNEVTGILKDFTFLPEKSKEQTMEQKRMMQEHIANGDPLFTSCVPTPSITCKRFNVKPCRVEITRLPKSLICNFQLGEQSLLSDETSNYERRYAQDVIEETAGVLEKSLDTSAIIIVTDSESRCHSSQASTVVTSDEDVDWAVSKRNVWCPLRKHMYSLREPEILILSDIDEKNKRENVKITDVISNVDVNCGTSKTNVQNPPPRNIRQVREPELLIHSDEDDEWNKRENLDITDVIRQVHVNCGIPKTNIPHPPRSTRQFREPENVILSDEVHEKNKRENARITDVTSDVDVNYGTSKTNVLRPPPKNTKQQFRGPEILIISDQDNENNNIGELRIKRRRKKSRKSKCDPRSKITFYMNGNVNNAMDQNTVDNKSRRKRKKVVEVYSKKSSLDAWLQNTATNSEVRSDTEWAGNADKSQRNDDGKQSSTLSTDPTAEDSNISCGLPEELGNNNSILVSPELQEIIVNRKYPCLEIPRCVHGIHN